MKKYKVTIARTAWKDFEVEANTEEEAIRMAEDSAYNHVWGREEAEYKSEVVCEC